MFFVAFTSPDCDIVRKKPFLFCSLQILRIGLAGSLRRFRNWTSPLSSWRWKSVKIQPWRWENSWWFVHLIEQFISLMSCFKTFYISLKYDDRDQSVYQNYTRLWLHFRFLAWFSKSKTSFLLRLIWPENDLNIFVHFLPQHWSTEFINDSLVLIVLIVLNRT